MPSCAKGRGGPGLRDGGRAREPARAGVGPACRRAFRVEFPLARRSSGDRPLPELFRRVRGRYKLSQRGKVIFHREQEHRHPGGGFAGDVRPGDAWGPGVCQHQARGLRVSSAPGAPGSTRTVTALAVLSGDQLQPRDPPACAPRKPLCRLPVWGIRALPSGSLSESEAQLENEGSGPAGLSGPVWLEPRWPLCLWRGRAADPPLRGPRKELARTWGCPHFSQNPGSPRLYTLVG